MDITPEREYCKAWRPAWNSRLLREVKSDFATKFGIPRQSGVVPGTVSYVVFEPEYANPDCLRGLEGYDYIWLIWGFFRQPARGLVAHRARRPRLGGNERRGGLRDALALPAEPPGPLEREARRPLSRARRGPCLRMTRRGFDGRARRSTTSSPTSARTYTAGARLGFSGGSWERGVEVDFPSELLERLPEEKRAAAVGVLEQDPRPAYQHDDERVYGVAFAGFDIRFRVADGVLSVVDVVKGE